MVSDRKTKGMDWLATVFYPLSVILMEAFWLSPWLNWIGQWPVFRGQWQTFSQTSLTITPWVSGVGFIPVFRAPMPVLTLISIVVILAASMAITRFVARLKLPLPLIQTIIIGAGIVVMLLVVAVEYGNDYAFLSGAWFAHTGAVLGNTFSHPGLIAAALPVIIYLWWRGIMLGQSTTYFKDIYRSFLIGMAALIFLIIFWKIGMGPNHILAPNAGLGLNVIAFFFFGLLSIAICHLYVMRSTMPREDAALTSVWRWMPLMLGVIGIMVLIGFGVASIFSPSLFESIGQAFGAVGHVLGKLLEYILTPFVYLFVGILWVFRWLLSLFHPQGQDFTNNATAGGVPPLGNVDTNTTPAWIGQTAKGLAIALVVGAVIFILSRAISKYRARKALDQIDEVNESLFSWKGLRDDLNLLFNMLGQRFKRKPGEGKTAVFDPDAAGRMDIREIFRHLQWEGRSSGVTRYRYETAAEYTHRLERAVPDSIEAIGQSRESIGNIKEMYETVRYGENSLPEPQIDKANSLWQTLKTMLRKLRGV